MVLKIHVVRPGGHHYYVHDLVPGRAEGSLVAGEEPGGWVGAGSVSLGLSGRVDSASFAELLAGRDPTTGRALRALRGERSVSGYDLTFAAPKSVSLLHLLAPREIAEAAGTGHHRAVADALDYLGREGVGVRRTRRGHVSFLSTTGPVAGQFLHRTSRALDPHLHTHVVVANVAEGVDGVWSGVDSRRLHAYLGAAQSLYHARLRFELGDRMGAAWRVRPSGLGDIIGVDPGLCHLFSTRSASMDEYRQRRGLRDAAAGSEAAAFHADRPGKDRTVTVDRLMAGWRQRASDLGYDLGDLTRAVGAHRRHEHLRVDPNQLRRQLVDLTREHRSIGGHHLVAALAASTEGGATTSQIEGAATRLMEACGTGLPGDGVAEGVTDGRWGTGPRWDPAHVVGVVASLPFDRAWPHDPHDPHDRHEARSVLDGPPGPGPVTSPRLARAPEPPGAPGTMTDGPSVRRHKVGGPAALGRSLGIER